MKLKFILLLRAILAKASAPGQASTLSPQAHPAANSRSVADARKLGLYLPLEGLTLGCGDQGAEQRWRLEGPERG